MTIALCLECGALKHGAFCKCNNCSSPSTGNPNLDIAFSDHVVSPEALNQLGAVIIEIRKRISDKQLGNDVFMLFVSKNTPQILKYEPKEADTTMINEGYALVKNMPISWNPGIRNGNPRSDSKGSWVALWIGLALIAIAAYLYMKS